MRAQDFSEFPFPALPDGALLCIGLRLDDAEAWRRECGFFATAAEKDRARRFVHAMDAARHLVGRALVRRVLRRSDPGLDLSADFARNPWGKPFCRGSDIDFSISHSGVMVWAAFCRGAFVGIDVEEILPLPDLPGLAEQLHPTERAAILTLPPEERGRAFYRCWTRKEAVLKAGGKGLNQALDSFRVSAEPVGRDWIVFPPEGGRDAWASADIAVDRGYHCSAAATEPRLELVVCAL